jgi:hypothetical protein
MPCIAEYLSSNACFRSLRQVIYCDHGTLDLLVSSHHSNISNSLIPLMVQTRSPLMFFAIIMIPNTTRIFQTKVSNLHFTPSFMRSQVKTSKISWKSMVVSRIMRGNTSLGALLPFTNCSSFLKQPAIDIFFGGP